MSLWYSLNLKGGKISISVNVDSKLPVKKINQFLRVWFGVKFAIILTSSQNIIQVTNENIIPKSDKNRHAPKYSINTFGTSENVGTSLKIPGNRNSTDVNKTLVDQTARLYDNASCFIFSI